MGQLQTVFRVGRLLADYCAACFRAVGRMGWRRTAGRVGRADSRVGTRYSPETVVVLGYERLIFIKHQFLLEFGGREQGILEIAEIPGRYNKVKEYHHAYKGDYIELYLSLFTGYETAQENRDQDEIAEIAGGQQGNEHGYMGQPIFFFVQEVKDKKGIDHHIDVRGTHEETFDVVACRIAVDRAFDQAVRVDGTRLIDHYRQVYYRNAYIDSEKDLEGIMDPGSVILVDDSPELVDGQVCH